MKPKKTCTVTEAKAKLSEIVSSVYHSREDVIITKKGRQVAVLVPIDTYLECLDSSDEGLIGAKGALHDLEGDIDAMTADIYEARENERSRTVDLGS